MGSLSALTILAGLADAIPLGPNAPLSKSLGLPVTAALLTRLVSTAALPVGGPALGKLEMPTGPQLKQMPWWAWLGGFLRVLLILAQLDASAAIGAATFWEIIVTVGGSPRSCSTILAGSGFECTRRACGASPGRC